MWNLWKSYFPKFVTVRYLTLLDKNKTIIVKMFAFILIQFYINIRP